ncbi:DUF3822 family protein [bacterium AH-315-M05]|nr:DUF3822 family protein [bacterium AH-315-M05]
MQSITTDPDIVVPIYESDNNRQLNLSILDESFDKKALSYYHLSIQLGLEGFSFCILDTKRNKYIGLGSSRFSKIHDYPNLCDEIKELIHKNDLLQNKYKSVSASIVHGKSTLIPTALFEKSNEKNYLLFNHSLENDEDIATDKLNNLDSLNLYALPHCVESTLKERFPAVKIYHHSSSLIEGLLIQYKNQNDKKLIIHFRSGSFDVVALDGKDLTLYNSFNYQTKEDFVYYILFVCEQLKLNPENLKLVLLGEIEKRSDHYSLLYKYIRNISFGERSGSFEYSYLFDEMPKHFYYNLFNQFLVIG